MTMSTSREAPPITLAESARRRDAVERASHSLTLEGLAPTPAYAALAERFIDGDIDLPQLIDGARAHHSRD